MAYYNYLNGKKGLHASKSSSRMESQVSGGWFKGGIGFISLVFSIGLLYKNEELYDEVAELIVDVGSDTVVSPANEGKLIYLTGRIEVGEPLTEPEYGVTIAAVKLKRRVQMYQWVEVHRETSWWDVNVEDVPQITYSTTWRDKLVDSSQFAKPFGHENPKSFPVESGISVSETVRVDGYTLSRELKDCFNTFTLLTSDQRPERRDIKMHSGLYYHSLDVWNPEVGDTRVQLSYAGAFDDLVTVLGRQVGRTLQPVYLGTEELTTVLEGVHPLSQVLSSAIKLPSSRVWLVRVPAYLALYCAFSSLTFTGKTSRLFYAFINNHKSLVCHILSAATHFTTVGVVWFPYSPIVGSLNLLAALLLAIYCIYKSYALYYYFNR